MSFLKKIRFPLLFLLLLFLFSSKISAAADEIGSGENDLFEFEAFIKDKEVLDGTAPFDSNDQLGNDSDPNNGIVRTFDTITYPVKVTINPKKADMLKNIRLKLTGTLKNGVTNGRVNARFAIGGKESIDQSKVEFEQFYTIAQTGNSIMIPVTVEVQGAETGVVLTPTIKVEVLSVDGQDISNDKISAEFKELKSVKTSGKVSVDVKVSKGYIGTSISQMLYQSVDSSATKDDFSMLYQFGVSFDVVPLKNKNNLKGATFPSGKLNFHIEISGRVDWDDPEEKNVNFNFLADNTPIQLFDYQNITTDLVRKGKEDTASETLGSYTWKYAKNHSVAQSKMTNTNDYEIVKQESGNHVWDSGIYSMEKSVVSSNKVKVNGSNYGYVIGSTFPEYRADNYKGSKAYAATEKAFSTQSFIVKSPNEYAVGTGKMNTKNKANNVYYTAQIVLDSYVDDEGKTIDLGLTSEKIIMLERNNPSGAYSLQTTFFSFPGQKQLGTVNVSYGNVSKGDTSVVLGQNVNIKADLNSRMYSYGGGTMIYKWNIESFELTEEFAEKALTYLYQYGYVTYDGSRISNNKNEQKIYFGVPKNKDMSFENITGYGKDDYTWYSTYKEAIKFGPVGAIKNDVQDILGSGTPFSTASIPLKVTTKKIGSKNEAGTYNVEAIQGYMYPDKQRKVEVVIKENGYNTPSLYDDLGSLTTLQSPVGNSVNFETLAILNAEVSSVATSDKQTYYNSELVNWSVKSSVVFPVTGQFGGEDNRIVLKQVLDKGLTYVLGSAKMAGQTKEPKVEKLADGRTTLSWDYLMSVDSKQVPDVTYQTSINPLALDSGVQTSQKVQTIISSPLDTRKEHLRTTESSISITKVGMVGIFESLDEAYGQKNSDYTLTVNPYTTIDNELEVKGITVLPYSGDKVGSQFSGETFLKEISIDSQKDVEIYLNSQVISTVNPNEVDLKKDQWVLYEPTKKQDLSQVKTVFFVIKDILTNKDEVSVHYKMGTKNNVFGDIYYNETSINTATKYKLSPVSNRVNYKIRPNFEVGLQRIRIFTAAAAKGLPVEINLEKEIINKAGESESVALNLYNKETGKKVAGKTYLAKDLPLSVTLTVPAKGLQIDQVQNYEARIEEYNPINVNTIDEEGKIDTDGHTASQKKITATDTKDKELKYQGVVMTEREIGKEIKAYYEDLNIPIAKLSKSKSGYGIDLNHYTLSYTNALGDLSTIQTKLLIDPNLVDSTMNLKEQSGFKAIDLITLDAEVDESETKESMSYEFPEVLIRQGDGASFLKAQKEEIELSSENQNLFEGGNKLYVPIWINGEGSYPIKFVSESPVGINEIEFEVINTQEIYAYMYATIDSHTKEDDELLLTPIYPDSTTPNGWSSEDIEWLRGK
ncbi:hypothetical protein [Enterococcus sp. RIT-PI-f]|uniref:hypothetical protein n=1 Tax=Enterococcus sp. RIT-PI-f TaxID=1690244 RepID=UPI0006B8DCD9|nr:hypothetical protein [Enterococcus sp. RIT-PI-f]KPG70830.1 hypothetical protein AEQ18_06500 [Enterococcus sp. RIT-PI-f]